MSSRATAKRINQQKKSNVRQPLRAPRVKSSNGEGIDMVAALGSVIGKYAGNGEGQDLRMKRYGRSRHR